MDFEWFAAIYSDRLGGPSVVIHDRKFAANRGMLSIELAKFNEISFSGIDATSLVLRRKQRQYCLFQKGLIDQAKVGFRDTAVCCDDDRIG